MGQIWNALKAVGSQVAKKAPSSKKKGEEESGKTWAWKARLQTNWSSKLSKFKDPKYYGFQGNSYKDWFDPDKREAVKQTHASSHKKSEYEDWKAKVNVKFEKDKKTTEENITAQIANGDHKEIESALMVALVPGDITDKSVKAAREQLQHAINNVKTKEAANIPSIVAKALLSDFETRSHVGDKVKKQFPELGNMAFTSKDGSYKDLDKLTARLTGNQGQNAQNETNKKTSQEAGASSPEVPAKVDNDQSQTAAPANASAPATQTQAPDASSQMVTFPGPGGKMITMTAGVAEMYFQNEREIRESETQNAAIQAGYMMKTGSVTLSPQASSAYEVTNESATGEVNTNNALTNADSKDKTQYRSTLLQNQIAANHKNSKRRGFAKSRGQKTKTVGQKL
jgi:hypothetical protein